jgi:uncharacterized protein YkwD
MFIAACVMLACAVIAAPAAAKLPARPPTPVPGLPFHAGVPSQARPLPTPTGPITRFPATPSSRWSRFLPSERVCGGQWAANASAGAQEKTMRCLINFARKVKKLAPARHNSRLRRSSQLKTQAMLRCNEFSHTPCAMNFSSTFAQAGYTRPNRPFMLGENLAWGTGVLGTPRRIMLAWLQSPAHRRNIFTPAWREQGVYLTWGNLAGQTDAAIWVSQFGRRG